MRKSLAIVVPVYNEETDLPRNIPILYRFLKKNMFSYRWKLIIADNGPGHISTDRTPHLAKELAKNHQEIEYTAVPDGNGRGGALRKAWMSQKADILAYMDVDLSSDLTYLPELINAIKGGADIAIGSRLAKGAHVFGRTLTREFISRTYNLGIRILFWTKFHDAQCGFKAISRRAADKLLPNIVDTGWFFDSELLIIASKSGYKIAEIPIIWRDDPASTVKVAKTAWGDIKGLMRLLVTRPWRNIKK